MKDAILKLKIDTIESIQICQESRELERIKTEIFGKKGELTAFLKQIVTLDKAERPKTGQLINQVKESLLLAFNQKESDLQKARMSDALNKEKADLTLPSVSAPSGHLHPITHVMNEIETLFSRLGFVVHHGPDMESDALNFEALNIPEDHPSRDMHDTFYLDTHKVLRTHTSPIQIRAMLNQQPPLRLLAFGKVYRYDSDTSHSPVFHQVEGLLVDNSVSFAELKGSLEYFLKSFFGDAYRVRFRSSYFPFTEPSVEVDVQWHEPGTPLHGKWFEVMGAGLVHRNVFRYVDYDCKNLSGFAFGMGIERLAMLKYKINDIRLFYENDLRFLEQF